ncbi:MAG: hypothetical protein ACI9LM_001358 [Alteromonadaceae bacterium]|jgi:hypothetical protein
MNINNYFFDNDVIIKLSQYDLLDELTVAFGNNLDSFYMLPTYEFVTFHHNDEKAAKLFQCFDAVRRSRMFFLSCSKAEIYDLKIMSTILKLEQPNLDAGELILLGCIMENENSAMVTGDKRALKEIDRVITERVIDPINAKFVILEMAIKSIIELYGYDHISNKVRLHPNVDKAITNCFGNHAKSTEENAMAGLMSYISDLQRKCANDLF